jgi:hypothetical protein
MFPQSCGMLRRIRKTPISLSSSSLFFAPPRPSEPTFKDKLATLGITIEDLKAELGIV